MIGDLGTERSCERALEDMSESMQMHAPKLPSRWLQGGQWRSKVKPEQSEEVNTLKNKVQQSKPSSPNGGREMHPWGNKQ